MKMKGGKSFKMKGGCIDSNTIIIVVGLLVLLGLGYYFMTIYNNTHLNPTMAPTMMPTMMANKVEGFTSGDDLTPRGDEKAVIALFAADWCPHCQTYKPTWQEIKSRADKEANKKVRFETVDCTDNNPYPGKYEISGYPTVVAIYPNGSSKHITERNTMEEILASV